MKLLQFLSQMKPEHCAILISWMKLLLFLSLCGFTFLLNLDFLIFSFPSMQILFQFLFFFFLFSACCIFSGCKLSFILFHFLSFVLSFRLFVLFHFFSFFRAIFRFRLFWFLDASSHLYMRSCPSVCWSVYEPLSLWKSSGQSNIDISECAGCAKCATCVTCATCASCA